MTRKSSGWTKERRERQALMIQVWRPWEYATGPKTANGKAISSRNAEKPGSIRRQLDAIVAEVNQLRRLVNNVAASPKRRS